MRRTVSDRIQFFVARATSWLPASAQIFLSGQPKRIVDGQQFDPQAQLLGRLRPRKPGYGLIRPTVEAGRRRYRHDTNTFRGPVTTVGTVRELELPGPDGPLRARHYLPPTLPARDITLYLHGGGWVIGDLDTHDEPCRILCREAGIHVLSLEYRLAPEHKFPAALEDTLAALTWLRENAASLGADPARISIGGDSAGANLATVASRIAADGNKPPAGQLLLYPPTDFKGKRRSHQLFGQEALLTLADGEDFARCYLEGTGAALDDPRVSPLFANLEKLPPAFVVTAGFDLLRDEGEAYADALAAAGNIVRQHRVTGFGHGFIHMTGVSKTARRAVQAIASEWRDLLDTIG
ncbi:MAG: alpha/beta hydrolase [Acidobacteriota bacterium]